MPTLAEVRTDLSEYAGANRNFLSRLNQVRARLLQTGKYSGTKDKIALTIYSDADGNSIVTLPRQYKTILAGAVNTGASLSVSPGQPYICNTPMGVRSEWSQFDPNGSGYNGYINDFEEAVGWYCVFQEWAGSMRLRFKFETSESAGTFLIKGTFSGEKVFSLYDGDWIEGEKVDYSGLTVTTTKYFDALGLRIVKPVTNGRVLMYIVDDDDNEILVAAYEPGETVPRWRRYRVPTCEDTAVTQSTSLPSSQYYTKSEIDAYFTDSGTITVSSTGTHDLVYGAYFMRTLKVVAEAGGGAYTHDFTLDNATVKTGGTLRVRMAVVASANPTLRFYDNTTGGTLLVTVVGDADNTTDYTLVFSFDGTNWNYDGRDV